MVDIEDVGRYIDGTLQAPEVHAPKVKFERVPMSGRSVPNGFACDFKVTLHGQSCLITVTTTEAA